MYTRAGHSDAAQPDAYRPEQHTQHIVVYDAELAYVLSLAQHLVGLDPPKIVLDWVLRPNQGGVPARLVHLEFDYVASDYNDEYRTTRLVFASGANVEGGPSEFTSWSLNGDDATFGGAHNGDRILWYAWAIENPGAYTERTMSSTIAPPASIATPDYTQIADVNGLYSVQDTFGNQYHVKLARFPGAGMWLFVLADIAADRDVRTEQVVYSLREGVWLGGHLPMPVPGDVDRVSSGGGMRDIVELSGGVSKFGGFRFVASDADGNLFLLRQRRAAAGTSPYTKPIYAFNDADGNPLPPYDLAYYEQGFLSPPSLPDVSPDSLNGDAQLWVASVNELGSTIVPGWALSSMLRNTAAAFATDSTILSEAVWLGSNVETVAAPRRFGFDSAHIVVQAAQGTDPDEVTAYAMFNDVVTKAWHKRQIASQIVPSRPGMTESGDHYQAMIAGMNAYGRQVPFSAQDNVGLSIEVRADSPTTVIDGANNRYFDIDRYTSFLAVPDTATGQLELLVKAETFAQVLYVRIVDTTQLQPSSTDVAMLAAPSDSSSSWVTINMAAQAQQRMSNDGTNKTVDLLGDDAPLVDATQYISGDNLTTASQDGNWQFKAGFAPTGSNSGNLGDLATYLNQSGQNMLNSSLELGQGVSPEIDPLTAITSFRSSLDAQSQSPQTTFVYNTGTITSGVAPTDPLPDDLGSIFSSISHAIHDALHWLQHVEGSVYRELATGAVTLVTSAESVVVTVSSDIMKAVNGVEAALTQVVQTIEEYASIVANVIVTIVEQSFLFQLIKDLIALISLFFHIKDIVDLSGSLSARLSAMAADTAGWPSEAIPAGYTSWSDVSEYFGANNTAESTMSGVNTSSVATEVAAEALDLIMNNPFIKKILVKLQSVVGAAIEDVESELPITFSLDDFDGVSDLMRDIAGIDAADAVSGVATDAVTTLITALADDIVDPQQTFADLEKNLGQVAAGLGQEVESLFGFVDTIATDGLAITDDALNGPLITINITWLADLLKLFRIANISDKVTVSAGDAIFFPIALVYWVVTYARTGQSISDISQLDPNSQDALSAVNIEDWDYAHIAVDALLPLLRGVGWSVQQEASFKDPPPTNDLILIFSNTVEVARRVSDALYTGAAWKLTGSTKPFDASFEAGRLATAVLSLYASTGDGSRNPGTGWPEDPTRLEILSLINASLNFAAIVWDADQLPADPDADQVLALVGQSIGRGQPIATFLFSLIKARDEAAAKSALALFEVFVVLCPLGFVLESLTVAPESEPPPETSGPGGRPDTPPGLSRRPATRPGQGRRPDAPPGQGRRPGVPPGR